MAQGRRPEIKSTFAERGRICRRRGRWPAFDFRVPRLRRLERRTTRGRDETKSVDRPKAQPRGSKIGEALAALVRHHEPARSMVPDACRCAGRSVTQLSDQRNMASGKFQMFYLVTCHSSLITC